MRSCISRVVIPLLTLVGCTSGEASLNEAKLREFATRYTAAWGRQNAASVASFFAENGSLKINAGVPAVGRPAITEAAQGFMTGFPDMVVTMDSLSLAGGRVTYHWTLNGTNTGPGGTGNAVRISGYEEWTIGTDGLIARSLGHFDEAEYQRQLTQDSRRYLIYLHGRIVEEGGRRPTDSTFGTYEYDAILDSLRGAGLTVLSDQRPPGIPIDTFVTQLVQQVDSLLGLGVPPQTITVIGFSRGGAIAILASSRLQNPAISFVFMGACGPWAFERSDIHVTGRILSLYETSDSLGVSCAPLIQRRGAGSQVREIPLSLGLGHGTFFQPRSAWLTPALAWARGRTP